MTMVTGNVAEVSPKLRTTALGEYTMPDSGVPGGDRISTGPTSRFRARTTRTESVMVSLAGFSSPVRAVKHVTPRVPTGPAVQAGNRTVSPKPAGSVS